LRCTLSPIFSNHVLPESLALKTGRGQKPACAILYKTFAATPTGKWHKCVPGVFETLRGADDAFLQNTIPARCTEEICCARCA
jgi:hypothetical protein